MMKPKEIIETEKEAARKKLSACFDLIQNILDSYEHITGDYIKEVTFSRVNPESYGDYGNVKHEIGHVDLIFY